MKFATAPAPHWRPAADVAAVMRQVLYALAPAVAAYTFFFGPGLLLNIVVATAAALATEALALRLRARPARVFLSDGSAVVTAVLFAFCLPPLTPWWITVTGIVFAVGVAKHLYGGLGYNLFNPAMAGYLVVLVAFPGKMTMWLPPTTGDLDYQSLSLWQTLQYTATASLPAGFEFDAVTRATPLTVVRTELGLMRTMSEIRVNPVFGDFGGVGWEWIGNFLTLGGMWLLYKGIIRWQIPAAMIVSLMACALVFYLTDPETHPSPLFHLYAGGTLLGAFFIATDPVSSTVTDRGRLIYGAGCGVLTYAIRTWGGYPDGVAFAVLLMNMAVPLIDRHTRPRIYGH
ncbi:MAG: RnfABCDGE type electron transport complex subunit D [Gammaproteobacteria bacterium]|nr:MAG: RnfABCDGE type electron transport complex subunit D [Gammaproteobacteria bacterium]